MYKDFHQFKHEVTLSEGVYDPGIFKAFFMAGGPGSGKSKMLIQIMLLR